MEYFKEFLNSGYIASYAINGNFRNINKVEWSTSDGVNSLSAVEIDTKTFCLKTFIKERGNHVDILEQHSYEEVEKLYELFPHIHLIAN